MEAPAPVHADAFLGLGSNVGNRPHNLRRGLRGLREAGIRTAGVSSLYLTEPVGADDHPWYLNCVAALQAPPDPSELLELCMEVERRCGRRRSDPAGPCDPQERDAAPEPRPLDLDLLLYGEEIRHDRHLTLPHPRLHERRFVLRPLTELDPEAWHPGRRSSAREMLEALPPGDGVWLLAPPPRPDSS